MAYQTASDLTSNEENSHQSGNCSRPTTSDGNVGMKVSIENGAKGQSPGSSSNDRKTVWFRNRRQLFVFAILIFGNFCSASCIALQAPFFPNEAEKKGATPAQYGFVFGVFQLSIFVVSPIYGKIMHHVTPKFVLDMGIFVMGISSLLFGTLAYSPKGTTFVSLAIAIRIAEGIGSAAYNTASATIVASEFPGREATTYGSIKTAFGVGVIAGPTIGGALYELGGFTLPFTCLGVMLLICTVTAAIFLPQTDGKSRNIPQRVSLKKFYFHRSVIVSALTVAIFYMCVSFNHVALEPHLRKTLGMTPFVVGLVYVASGGTYGISAPLWGWFCDKGVPPKVFVLMGILLLSTDFILIAPAPFLHLELKLWIAFCSMVLFGIGNGAGLVSTFADCLKGVTRRGYPNNISTLGLISAMYTGSAAFGAFVGPTLGGFIVEKYGFQRGTLVLHAFLMLLFVIVLSCIFRDKRTSRRTDGLTSRESDEKTPLLLDGSSTNIQTLT